MKEKPYKSPYTSYLGTFNWSNPNTFNAVDSAIAFLAVIAVIAVFYLVQLALSPLAALLIKSNVDIGFILCLLTIVSQAAIFGLSIVLCKIKRVSLFRGSGFKFSFKTLDIIFAVMLTFGIYFVVSPLQLTFAEDMSEIQKFFFGQGTGTDLISLLEKSNILNILVYEFILVPVLPAICEESLFRGVVMRGFTEFGAVFACLASGLLFALMHGNYAQFILQFVLGSGIAAVVLITKNYALGCIMHFANNFFVSIFAIIAEVSEKLFYNGAAIVNCIYAIAGIAFLVVSVVYFGKKARQAYDKKLLANFGISLPPRSQSVSAKKATDNCCILQKGAPENYCRVDDCSNYDVVSYNNYNLLFLYKGAFYSFNKKSNKVVFYILFGGGIAISLMLILIDFIIVV